LSSIEFDEASFFLDFLRQIILVALNDVLEADYS
jgi:hypothetical protein